MNVLEFFTSNFKPGAIGLVGTTDLMGRAIREAQKSFTLDGLPSRWCHALIFGGLRLDRHNPDSNDFSMVPSLHIFESSFDIYPSTAQIRNGVQENWIGNWCDNQTDQACVVDFNLSEAERDNVLATALQLVDEQVSFPILGLAEVWLKIAVNRLWEPNPFIGRNSMFCSQFARYCYRTANRDFLGSEVDISNTAPEHIYQAGLKSGKIIE